MKVVLVNPPESTYQDHFSRTHPYAPLGLAYLAAYIRERGVDVEIIDAHIEKLKLNILLKRIDKAQPNLIGMSIFTQGRFPAMEFARGIKRYFPKIPLVVGGPHATLCTEDLLQNVPEIDYIIQSEGEVTLMELCQFIERGDDPHDIDGISFIDVGTVIQRRKRPAIGDLDSLPFPARDLLPIGLYKSNIRTAATKVEGAAEGLITSRGCPMNCYYCASTRVEPRWRGRSPENVIEEMKLIIDQYKKRNFFIWDDAFTFDVERAERILQLIITERLDVKYILHSRFRNLSLELIKLLKESGCAGLRMGAESGSPEILKQITAPRKQTVEEIYQAADWCERVGLQADISFIISHPNETEDNIEQTMDVIRRLAKFRNVATHLNVMHIYPGSKVEEYARKHGILPANFSWSQKTDDKNLESITAFDGEIPVFMDKVDMPTIYKYLAQWAKIAERSPLQVLGQIIRNIRYKEDLYRLLYMAKAYLLRNFT
jgi:radical SAM superfamily enzyme YgiQ (UPF0313 family)